MCVRLGNEDLDKNGDKCRYSVTEQQLCRRLHIPGFRRQCHYYCILGEKQHDSRSQWKSASKRNRKKKNYSSYFFKSHGTEFVYFECVLQTGNRSSCIDVRPELRRLFEHVWILLVLYRTKNEIKKYSANRIYQQTLFWYIL